MLKYLPYSAFYLLFALTFVACDSSDTDDDPGPGDDNDELRCTAPTLSNVADGRFLIDYYNDADPTEHTGDAVFGFVEDEGTSYFVLHFPESDDLVFSVFGERGELPAAGTFELNTLTGEPFVGWIEDSSSGFFTGSAPGELRLDAVSEDLVTGRFAFGNSDSDYGACGAFKAAPSDDIDPDEVAGF